MTFIPDENGPCVSIPIATLFDLVVSLTKVQSTLAVCSGDEDVSQELTDRCDEAVDVLDVTIKSVRDTIQSAGRPTREPRGD